MKKILILLIMAAGTYQAWEHFNPEEPVVYRIAAHDQVIMYSLTTCGYCKAKAKELDQAGIRYYEYFIDKEPARKTELNQKIKLAGLPPRRWGVPIMDVKGVILPNNPSMENILKHLQDLPG